jgi:hypothetical protein
MVSAPESPSPSPGGITLVRHGLPALSRDVRLSAAEYREFWAKYEVGGLIPDQVPPEDLPPLAARAKSLFASTRRRSIESMQLVAPGRSFVQEPLLIEAPLPPPSLPSFVRLDPRTWGFISRSLWWFLNICPPGLENRPQAEARAALVADRLVAAAESGEVVVVAHGFFNAVIGRELKKRGWKRTAAMRMLHWNSRRYERG